MALMGCANPSESKFIPRPNYVSSEEPRAAVAGYLGKAVAVGMDASNRDRLVSIPPHHHPGPCEEGFSSDRALWEAYPVAAEAS